MKYRAKPQRVYLNYGSSTAPAWKAQPSKWLNNPNAVRIASNKLLTFLALRDSGVNIPEFTTNKEDAKAYATEKRPVVCRTVLNGHSGYGIVLRTVDQVLPDAPLYVKYYPKEYEYRVHVFQGKVVDIQQKRKRTNYQGEPDLKIRNHHTGWVYCRHSYVPPPCIDQIKEHCIKAVATLCLDFGAVDVIYSKKNNSFVILEINTAPGMEGETINIYANQIKGALA